MNKQFDNWNDLKKQLNDNDNLIHFRQGQIYFVSIGQNIGQESYGKNSKFLRPVLIYKKLSKTTFIGIPLTSKRKEGSYYISFEYKKNIKSTAMLNQIRIFDIKRFKYYSGNIKKEDYNKVKVKVKVKIINFIDITPKKGGGITPYYKEQRKSLSIEIDGIVSKQIKNVNSVFIIAEAGVNHNGSLKLAKKLIDVASVAGADAVKFQTFRAKNLVSKNAQKADYQKETTDSKESQFNMIKKLELDMDAHLELISYCKSKNIMFLSTPFDLDSIDLLYDLKLPIFKIPSGEITNLPYLRKIGSLKKEIILSTGMANIGEIEDALDILIKAGTLKENITVLHANTMYPTPMEDVNLKAMVTIGNTFDIKYGYSDHTLGIEVDIAAVAMGATIIEKHFTLDKNMDGPDHKASLEPNELKDMVKSIRNIELALGSSIKKPSKSEMPNIKIARKSIVANSEIKKGEILTENNLAIKRPATGINPMRWDEIVGSVAIKDYKEDEFI